MELVKLIQKQMIEEGVGGNKELEKLSGVGYGVILRLMSGGNSIKQKDINAIASVLKIDISYSIKGEG